MNSREVYLDMSIRQFLRREVCMTNATLRLYMLYPMVVTLYVILGSATWLILILKDILYRMEVMQVASFSKISLPVCTLACRSTLVTRLYGHRRSANTG